MGMDKNVPGPSTSSSDESHQSKPDASSTDWSSFASVPPPPAPFGLEDNSEHSTTNGEEEESLFYVNGEVEAVDGEEEDDLDTLLFGSASFFPQPRHRNIDEEDDLDAMLYGSSLLSFATGKNEEVSLAFQGAAKDSSSTTLFRAITEPQPEVPLKNGHGHKNGSSSSSNNTHVFPVTSASPSPTNLLSVEGLKLKPDVHSSSNKHVQHPEDDNEEHTASAGSLQNHKTDDEVPAVSGVSSDSGGVSEEDARISSGPFCSTTTSHVPELTLSDISGPCCSSIVDTVPASFIDGDDDDECGSGCGAAKVVGEKDKELLSHRPEIKASTSASATNHSGRNGKTRELIGHGSSTTSTTSLSDSNEEEDTEGHRVLSSRHGSLKDQDGLPFPPPPPLLLGGAEEEIVPMTVDTCEDYWSRLHDIRINGCILEYMGIGKSIHDNGFAQSNVPLTPLNHYFEITILDPGEYCYISIGLARKDYSIHKNPGWCRGSIAYHADDGKIFIGGGVGTPFGPRCASNDVLGCGIIFPDKYGELSEGSSWPWEVVTEEDKIKCDGLDKSKENTKSRLPSRHHRKKLRVYSMDNFGDISSESEDDIWWNNKNQVCEDKVKVFFMRNRKLLGIKEVRIPKGGFYPTIGMMSTNERVSVDLQPLTG